MDDHENDVESAWQNHAYAEPYPTAILQFTSKVAPSFDGRVSWLSYKEAIDDWCDITELDQAKRGPALRNRLEGDAAVYKPLLDRAALAAPTGVTYLKTQLRQHFVKGNQTIFLWRFFQLMKAHRGSQDLLRWIGRFAVLRKRLADSWMDLFEPTLANDPAYYQAYKEQAQQANGAGQPPVSVDEFLIGYNDMRRFVHQAGFPVSDNLLALIFTVLADLTEPQRERMQSAMSLEGQRVQDYTFAGDREVFIEPFCAPRSSLDNPNLRGFSGGRSFCIIDQGEMDGNTGYWVEDDSNGEVGFLMEFEDTFWVWKETGPTELEHHWTGEAIFLKV
jgi:hypothetical protein